MSSENQLLQDCILQPSQTLSCSPPCQLQKGNQLSLNYILLKNLPCLGINEFSSNEFCCPRWSVTRGTLRTISTKLNNRESAAFPQHHPQITYQVRSRLSSIAQLQVMGLYSKRILLADDLLATIKKPVLAGRWRHTVFERQRQADLCKFKSSLVQRATCMTARARTHTQSGIESYLQDSQGQHTHTHSYTKIIYCIFQSVLILSTIRPSL